MFIYFTHCSNGVAKERQKDIYDELKQLEIVAIDEKEILELYKKAINKI